MTCSKVKIKLSLSRPWGAQLHLHPFLTSVQDRSEWLTSDPATLLYGKKYWYPLNRRLGGPQSRVDASEKREITHTVQDQNTDCFRKNELHGCSRNTLWPNVRRSSGTCLVKYVEKLARANVFGQTFETGLPENVVRGLSTGQRC